jgi:hypothetical protein
MQNGPQGPSWQALRRSVKRLTACLALSGAVLPCLLVGCGDSGGATATSSVPTVERGGQAAGGEKSIEDFGSEAEGPTRTAILRARRSYLAAIASRRYASGCSRLAGAVRRSLTELIASKEGMSCASALRGFLAPGASTIMEQQARGTVRKVRVASDRAFVVFHAPGARLYQLPLVHERGRWRVGLLAASVLVPFLAPAR